jgi:hypothetical protein
VFIVEMGGHMFLALHHWVSGNIDKPAVGLPYFFLSRL